MLNIKYYYVKFLLFVPVFLFAELYIQRTEIKNKHWKSLFKEFNETFINQNKTFHELNELFSGLSADKHLLNIVIPILVFGCNRPTITRTLDQLIKLRPSKDLFPIYISLGCSNLKLDNVLKQYVENVTILKHKQRVLSSKISSWQQGYYHISYHYKWALGIVFKTLKSVNDAIIIVEDDFDLAPDFFEYFQATQPLLIKDPTIWCISCWNDNGLPNLILNDPRLLYRTDFFPGLGWMMTKALWLELEPKWPEAYWDDWMRDPVQRRNRTCVRPELSRVYTFGHDGVSKGQYFESHLSKSVLNSQFVNFTRQPALVERLIKEVYDPVYLHEVRNESQSTSADDLLRILPESDEALAEPLGPSYKITYEGEGGFKALADTFGLMSDFRGGVARTSYLGIVSFIFRGHRVHLVEQKFD